MALKERNGRKDTTVDANILSLLKAASRDYAAYALSASQSINVIRTVKVRTSATKII